MTAGVKFLHVERWRSRVQESHAGLDSPRKSLQLCRQPARLVLARLSTLPAACLH